MVTALCMCVQHNRPDTAAMLIDKMTVQERRKYITVSRVLCQGSKYENVIGLVQQTSRLNVMYLSEANK